MLWKSTPWCVDGNHFALANEHSSLTNTHECTHIHTYIHTYIHTRTHTHTHIHSHTHTHTHTHKYTHVHTCLEPNNYTIAVLKSSLNCEHTHKCFLLANKVAIFWMGVLFAGSLIMLCCPRQLPRLATVCMCVCVCYVYVCAYVSCV